jgi:hypothetical protein
MKQFISELISWIPTVLYASFIFGIIVLGILTAPFILPFILIYDLGKKFCK